jgi:putative transposase
MLGLTLDCYGTAANVADMKAAPAIWGEVLEKHERISKILADQSYRFEAMTKLLQS